MKNSFTTDSPPPAKHRHAIITLGALGAFAIAVQETLIPASVVRLAVGINFDELDRHVTKQVREFNAVVKDGDFETFHTTNIPCRMFSA